MPERFFAMARGWNNARRAGSAARGALGCGWRKPPGRHLRQGRIILPLPFPSVPENAPLLNRIGEEVAVTYGVPWLPSDFKKKNGYKRSVELSAKYEPVPAELLWLRIFHAGEGTGAVN